MTRKSFGITLFVAGLNSIIMMIVGVYLTVIPNIFLNIDFDIYQWFIMNPLGRLFNIIGSISGILGFILIILYLIFGYQYAKQSQNPILMQFWNKILVGLILQIGLTILSITISFVLNPSTVGFEVYLIISQVLNIVYEIITIISLSFLIRGWQHYMQYAKRQETPDSVKQSGLIKKGYQILRIVAIATITLVVLGFLVIYIPALFSIYLPLLEEIFTIFYYILRSILDIGLIIVGPVFILTGQIKLGRELMAYSTSKATEPILSETQLYGQPQNRKFCKQCGASMLIEAKFCPHCGQSM